MRRAISIVVLAAVTASCADKGFTNPRTAPSTSFALQVIAPAAQASESGPKFLLIAAWYNVTTTGGAQARVVIGGRSVALGTGTQSVSLNLDIATCLADARRAEPTGSCQFDVIAALVADTITFLGTDTKFEERSWDFAWLQGLEAKPGQPPTIPPINLSLTRFDQPTRLVFKAPPPASIEVGTSFGVEVAVEKAKGGIATTAAPTVALVLSAGGTAQLGGQTTRTAVNGVATFTGLTVDKAGTGYALTATTPGLTNGTSASFAVTPVTAPPSPPSTPPPPPPPPPPSNVNAYDGTYQGTGVVTADDGSSSTFAGTMTVSSGAVSFTVGGFTMTGSVALSGLITFVIPSDAAARCNPTAMTGQITISASGVATMVGSGSQNDRGISPTGGCIPGRQTYTFSATRGSSLPPAPATPTAADFVGVWTGSVTDTASGHTHPAMLVLTASGGVLSGTINGPGSPPITNVALSNGVLTFTWPNSPEGASDPRCQHWNISVSATLDATRQTMSMQFSGRGCGDSPATEVTNGTGVLSKGSGATAADFVGRWTGPYAATAVSTTAREEVAGSMTLVLSVSGGTLTGTIEDSQSGAPTDPQAIPGPRSLTNIALNGGILSFSVPRSSNHPDCAVWNVTLTGALDGSRSRMTLVFSGTGCSPPTTTTTVSGSAVLTRSP